MASSNSCHPSLLLNPWDRDVVPRVHVVVAAAEDVLRVPVGVERVVELEPVVPVAVDSGRLKHGWIRLPGTITYRVCEEIPPGLPRDEAEARIHAAINSLNG